MESTKVKKKKINKDLYTGTGRRKTSMASVWLYDKKGEIKVNGKLISDYFKSSEAALEWVKPFHAIGVAHPQAKFSADIKVKGGGSTGQLEATRLGISRALMKLDPTFRGILRSNNLLTRDSRAVERKKPFLVKARKRPQYSKR